ncbi:MAG: XdhC family protein [Pseudomonadota bacterium]
MPAAINPLAMACAQLKDGVPVAVATVVETWGSAPVPVGGQLVVVDETTFFGSVSGGCVENEVIIQALDCIQSGKPQLLEFGIEDDTAWSVGLPCGGQIQVFVERFSPRDDADAVASLQSAVANRVLSQWQTDVETGKRTYEVISTTAESAAVPGLPGGGGGQASGLRQVTGDVSGKALLDAGDHADTGDKRLFTHVVRPPARLAVIGATHIAQVLTELISATGFQAVIIDPREAYANEARFANATLMRAWPADALPELGLDGFTGVAALAHVPDIDDPALKLAVDSPAFYVGALGSRRNHAKRRERLLAAGMPQDRFARIRCPIGLDIGAVNPAEIAVSVMAEFVLALRGQKRVAKAA